MSLDVIDRLKKITTRYTNLILVLLITVATVFPLIRFRNLSYYLPSQCFGFGRIPLSGNYTNIPDTSVTRYMFQQQSVNNSFMAFQEMLSRVTGLDPLQLFSFISLWFLFPLFFYLYAREFTDTRKALYVTLFFVLVSSHLMDLAAYFNRTTIGVLLLIIAIVLLAKLTRRTTQSRYTYLILVLLVVAPLPFMNYTALILALIFIGSLGLVLLVAQGVTAGKHSLLDIKQTPAYAFILVFLFLSLLTFLRAMTSLEFNQQLSGILTFMLKPETYIPVFPEVPIETAVALDPWYAQKPAMVGLYILQYIPIAVFGGLYLVYLVRSYLKRRLKSNPSLASGTRADIFILGVLLGVVVACGALSLQGFVWRWAEVIPLVGIPLVAVVSQRMSTRHFVTLILTLCVVTLIVTTLYSSISPGHRYLKYNEKEVAGYSFISAHVSSDKLIYTDMKSVNGLVLVGNHLNTEHSFDFMHEGKHLIHPDIQIFYSPDNFNFEEEDMYIFIGDYMYTEGVTPMNEQYPPVPLEKRQALLNREDVALLYNNGDVWILGTAFAISK